MKGIVDTLLKYFKKNPTSPYNINSEDFEKRKPKWLKTDLAKKVEDELGHNIETYLSLRDNIDNLSEFTIINFNALVREGLELIVNEDVQLHSEYYSKKAQLIQQVERVLFSKIGYLLCGKKPEGDSAEKNEEYCFRLGLEYAKEYFASTKNPFSDEGKK